MPRYQFTSPGAAFGNAMVDTLTERRLEQRQRMLDEIAAKNAESDRARTDELIRASQENREREKLQTILPGLEYGADLTNNPNLDLLEKFGYATNQSPLPTPSVSTEEQATGVPGQSGVSVDPTDQPVVQSQPSTPKPTGKFFTGTPTDRKTERIRHNIGSIVGLLNDPKVSMIEKIVALQQATEDPNLPAGAFSAMEPREPMISVDYLGHTKPVTGPDGKPVLGPPGGRSIVQLPQPYREPTPPNSQIQFSPDGKMYWVNPRAKTIEPAQLPNGLNGPLLKQSTASNKKAGPVLPANVAQNGAKLRAAASTTGSDKDVNAYSEWATNALEMANVSDQSVKDEVRKILIADDPRSAEEIVKDLTGPETTQQEAAEFVSLLRELRGR